MAVAAPVHRPVAIPAGLPPLPEPAPRSRPSFHAAAPVVAGVPLALLLGSMIIGGGPRTDSADRALLTLATRDAMRGQQLLGPYSRFGWHHPGPTYFYLLTLPTWLAHGGPAGVWAGAAAISLITVVATVAIVRRWAGPVAGWWAAAAVLAVVAGATPAVLRNPWNPYVVALPVLFVLVACAFAGAGQKGAFPWALVVGSFAVQTHVSTAPVVFAALLLAATAMAVRWLWGRRAGPAAAPHIPAGLPSIGPLQDPEPWWRYRPDVAVAVMILIAEWLAPLWDEAFGSGNLSSLVSFFTTRHPGHSWGEAWRITTAMGGATLWQHHAALNDGVFDHHPLVTTGVYVALAAVAIVAGAGRGRPLAVWLGAMALVAGVVAVYSETQVVGFPFRYLVTWMTVLPVLPVLAVVVALQGVGWSAAVRAVTVAAVAGASILGVVGVLNAPPAAALTDPDIATAWQIVQPVVAGARGPVHIQIAQGGRWPAAAGLGLELEQHGHPVRVDGVWTTLFGSRRAERGNDALTIILAGEDVTGWQAPPVATRLGQAGPNVIFAVRSGPQCWWGWLPLGGPACPPLVAPQGPTLTPR